MAKLFLHVGAPKTGTSSIQDNLQRHSHVLAEIGLSYPTALNGLFDYPHRDFISTGNANPLAYSMRFAGDPETYRAFRPDVVLEALGGVLEGEENAILSHEDLLFASTGWLAQFREWAGARGYTVCPVLYVRDQISWHISNFQQHVRQLMTDSSIYAVMARSMVIPDWSRFTGKFAETFGRERLVVRLYQRRAGGNLVADFIGHLGFDAGPLRDLQMADRNVGISSQAALLMSHFHRHSRNKSQQQRMLELIQSSPVRPPPFQFPAEMQEFLCAYYERCNGELCEQYLSPEDAAALQRAMQPDKAARSGGEEASLEMAAELLSRIA
jgi:hypothetical protein